MNRSKKNGYKEVMLDNNGNGADRSCHNPLTEVFQYEYALYKVVSELFGSVRNHSMCMGRLESYFLELPPKSESGDVKKPEKKTREKLFEEVSGLVDRDVTGKINFPRMNICAVETAAFPEEDGTHTFVFTDGIYGFSLHVDMSEKGHMTGIKVKDLYPKAPGKVAGSIENATLSGAA